LPVPSSVELQSLFWAQGESYFANAMILRKRATLSALVPSPTLPDAYRSSEMRPTSTPFSTIVVSAPRTRTLKVCQSPCLTAADQRLTNMAGKVALRK